MKRIRNLAFLTFSLTVLMTGPGAALGSWYCEPWWLYECSKRGYSDDELCEMEADIDCPGVCYNEFGTYYQSAWCDTHPFDENEWVAYCQCSEPG